MIAPYGAKGSVLISPSMCHQADEVFLTPFKSQITTDWDVTNLHINKKDMEGVNKVRLTTLVRIPIGGSQLKGVRISIIIGLPTTSLCG